MSSSSLNRRAALRLASGIGIGGILSLETGLNPAIGAEHAPEDRAIEIEWLWYTDAAGAELGQMRPYSMLDITNHDGLRTPAGQRDLWLHLRIRNTGTADLVVPPSAFALWATSGFLYRPHDVYAGASGEGRGDRPFHHGNHWYLVGAEYRITADPIAPRAERSGNVTFRVPTETWFAGLLFTPEPERVLVLADFRRTASVIID